MCLSDVGAREQHALAEEERQAGGQRTPDRLGRYVCDVDAARAQLLGGLGSDRRHGDAGEVGPAQAEGLQAAPDVHDGIGAGEDGPVIARQVTQRLVKRAIVAGRVDPKERSLHGLGARRAQGRGKRPRLRARPRHQHTPAGQGPCAG